MDATLSSALNFNVLSSPGLIHPVLHDILLLPYCTLLHLHFCIMLHSQALWLTSKSRFAASAAPQSDICKSNSSDILIDLVCSSTSFSSLKSTMIIFQPSSSSFRQWLSLLGLPPGFSIDFWNTPWNTKIPGMHCTKIIKTRSLAPFRIQTFVRGRNWAGIAHSRSRTSSRRGGWSSLTPDDLNNTRRLKITESG